MKKIFLSGLFVVFAFSSFGQKIRFTDSTNVWEFRDIVFDLSVETSTVSISYWGTEMVDSNKYLKLGSSIIREDTTSHKVFMRSFNSAIGSYDSVDEILYDYTLLIGDSIIHNHPGHSSISWITLVDSTQINGSWYKVWHFSGIATPPGGGYTYNVIEGLDCTNGLEYPFNPYPPFEGSNQLICFHNRGASPVLSYPVSSWGLLGTIYFDDTTSCNIPLIANQTSHKSINNIIVSNPIDQSSKIIFSTNISSGSVVVFNDLGQTVFNVPFQNRDEILIGDKIKVPGIYYYRVMDNDDGTLFTGKFVKQ